MFHSVKVLCLTDNNVPYAARYYCGNDELLEVMANKGAQYHTYYVSHLDLTWLTTKPERSTVESGTPLERWENQTLFFT
jgi:hypothetical protein